MEKRKADLVFLQKRKSYGVLLSGGLDSSLVASVASRYAPARVEEGGKTKVTEFFFFGFSRPVFYCSGEIGLVEHFAHFCDRSQRSVGFAIRKESR